MIKNKYKIILSVVVSFYAFFAAAQTDELAQYISMMNAVCPIKANDFTTLSGFRYENQNVVILYELSAAIDKEQMNSMYGTKSYRDSFLKSYVTSKGTKPLVDKIVKANAGLQIQMKNISTQAEVIITYSSNEIKKVCNIGEESKFNTHYYDSLSQSFPKAQEFIDKASQGDAEAMFQLALCYRRGRGVESDQAECVAWLKRAVEKNHTKAQYYLAFYYENGEGGLHVDSVMAYKYYALAAEQKDLFSMIRLGESYRTFKGIPNAQKSCIKWLKQISERDYNSEFSDNGLEESLAEFYLYYLYQGNEGVKRDISLSMMYLRRAVSHGERSINQAYNAMGECFLDGNGVQQDKSEAIKWFKKCSKYYGIGMGNLGIIYYNDGEFVEAFRYLLMACEDNPYPSPKAMRLLSACYKYGRGTSVNEKLGEYWMLEAAKHKEPNAIELLKLNK